MTFDSSDFFTDFKNIFSVPDLSPSASRDAHMVLVLDLRKREQHDDLTAKVIEQYGKVRCLIDSIHGHDD